MTVRDGGGALMSETIALPLLMGGAYLLSKEKPAFWHGLLAGVLLGSATLVRATPVFPAVAVVAMLLGESQVRRDWYTARIGVIVGLGGLCMLAAVVVPYVLVGQADMLIRSALLAPVAYVEERGRGSMFDLLISLRDSMSIGGTFLFTMAGLVIGAMASPKAGFWRMAAMFFAILIGLAQGPAGGF